VTLVSGHFLKNVFSTGRHVSPILYSSPVGYFFLVFEKFAGFCDRDSVKRKIRSFLFRNVFFIRGAILQTFLKILNSPFLCRSRRIGKKF
jgi:hypothetical protein